MDAQIALDRRPQVEDFQRRHHTKLVTMLFSDIVGSAKLKQALGERGAIDAIQRHHGQFREILAQFDEGEEISTAGDSFFAVFAKPSDAVRFSLVLQSALRDLAGQSGHPVFDRIGIHVGEVWVEDTAAPGRSKDLYGLQVDTCARVSSLGGADQILMTRFAFDSARQVLKGEDLESLGTLSWLNHGLYVMKGMDEPIEVCEVGENEKAQLAPPADSEKVRRFVASDSEPVLGWRPAVDQPVPGTSWVLEKKLGEGGIGEVWLGRDKNLKTLHVFKFCFRADRVRSLKREVTLFRLLKERIGTHPNIVGVEATYFDEPPYYIVLQHVDGSNLPEWCEAQGGIEAVPLAVRLEIVAQAADALQAEHDSGVIHRDVKPTNILISGSSVNDVRVHLTDFGIGQVVTEEALAGLTRAGFTQTIMESGSHSGTQLYMAPELFAGLPASIRSDIYSLGVVLYQLLVGDFSRPVTTDWAKQIEEPLLREDLEGCFAGDPQERFAGAAELADRLRSLERRRIAQAAERSAQETREKAAYRRGVLRTALVSVSVIALITLLATSAYREAGRAERNAVTAEERQREAETQTQAARQALSQSYFLQAQEFWKRDQLSHATAHASRAVRTDETNKAAVTLLYTLMQEGWNWPVGGPIHCDEETDIVEVNSDFSRLLFGGSKPRLWNLHTRTPIVSEIESLSVEAAQFSPDGRKLLTAHGTGGARIWDALTGKPLSRKLTESTDSVAFSPDGKRFITFNNGDHLRVWNTDTLEPITAPMAHGHGVPFVAFVDDGIRVATLEAGGSFENPSIVRLWDARKGRELTQKRKVEIPSGLVEVGFSPDGEQILTASVRLTLKEGEEGEWDGTFRMLDADTLDPLISPVNCEGTPSILSFSPDGESFAIVFDDDVRIWKTRTGTPQSPVISHPNSVCSVDYSPDGQRLLATCNDHTSRLWDAYTGEPVCGPMNHGKFVDRATFSSDGRQVIAVSGGDSPSRTEVQIWDARPRRSVAIVPNLQDGNSEGIEEQFGSNRRIIVYLNNGRVRLHDLELDSEVPSPISEHGGMLGAQFSPDGRRIVTRSKNTGASLWDGATFELVASLPTRGESSFSAFGKDGRFIVTTSGNSAQVWNATTGVAEGEAIHCTEPLISAEVSGNDRLLTVSAKAARVWDYRKGVPVTGELTTAGLRIESAVLSTDGSVVMMASSVQIGNSSSNDIETQVWDAQSGEPLTGSLKYLGRVRMIDFDPDQKHVVTIGGYARVWDVLTGRPLSPEMKDQTVHTYVKFSPDRQRIVTIGGAMSWRDFPIPTGIARVWDARTGQPLSKALKLSRVGGVHFADFSPDNQRLIIGGEGLHVCETPDFSAATERPYLKLMCDLAEAACGNRVNHVGAMERLGISEVNEIRTWVETELERIGEANEPILKFLAWYLADPEFRSISPFVQIPITSWVQRQLDSNLERLGLREALLTAPTNATLVGHLGLDYASYSDREELRKSKERDEIHRSAEMFVTIPSDMIFQSLTAEEAARLSDFYTLRAVELEPSNEELRMLREGVLSTLKAVKGYVPIRSASTDIPIAESEFIEEFDSDSRGVAPGIRYVSTPTGRGAAFSRTDGSRVEYSFANGFPTEGTLDWRIKVSSGYKYTKGVLSTDNPDALIFTTVGPDTWYPGCSWLTLSKNGTVTFGMADSDGYGGRTPVRSLTAKDTGFTFEEWHTVGISFGSGGRSINVDGRIVAHDNLSLPLVAGGNRPDQICAPTVGEMESRFWPKHQHDSGFEGIVDSFRVSSKQSDWKLCK